MGTEEDEPDQLVFALFAVGAEDHRIVSFYPAGVAEKVDDQEEFFHRATVIAPEATFRISRWAVRSVNIRGERPAATALATSLMIAAVL